MPKAASEMPYTLADASAPEAPHILADELPPEIKPKIEEASIPKQEPEVKEERKEPERDEWNKFVEKWEALNRPLAEVIKRGAY